MFPRKKSLLFGEVCNCESFGNRDKLSLIKVRKRDFPARKLALSLSYEPLRWRHLAHKYAIFSYLRSSITKV